MAASTKSALAEKFGWRHLLMGWCIRMSQNYSEIIAATLLPIGITSRSVNS